MNHPSILLPWLTNTFSSDDIVALGKVVIAMGCALRIYFIYVGYLGTVFILNRLHILYLYYFIGYCVMHSAGNSFCGDVVFDSFDMRYRGEDSNLQPKYEKEISEDLYYKDFKF